MSRKRPIRLPSAPSGVESTDKDALSTKSQSDAPRPLKRYLSNALAAELQSLHISKGKAATKDSANNAPILSQQPQQQLDPFGATYSTSSSPFLSPKPTSTFATNFTPHSAFSFSSSPVLQPASTRQRHKNEPDTYDDFVTSLPDPGSTNFRKRHNPFSSSLKNGQVHKLRRSDPLKRRPNFISSSPSSSSSSMATETNAMDNDDENRDDLLTRAQRRKIKRRRTYEKYFGSKNDNLFNQKPPLSSNYSNNIFSNDIVIEETDEPVTDKETRVVVYNPSVSTTSSSPSPSSSSTSLVSPLIVNNPPRSLTPKSKSPASSVNGLFRYSRKGLMIPMDTGKRIEENENSLAVVPWTPSPETHLAELVQRPNKVIRVPWTDDNSRSASIGNEMKIENEIGWLNHIGNVDQDMEIEEIK